MKEQNYVHNVTSALCRAIGQGIVRDKWQALAFLAGHAASDGFSSLTMTDKEIADIFAKVDARRSERKS